MEQKTTFQLPDGLKISPIENIQTKYKKSLVSAQTLLSAEQASAFWKKGVSLAMKTEQGEFFWTLPGTQVPKNSQIVYNEQGEVVLQATIGG